MFLTIPHVLGIDESPGDNLLRQISVRGRAIEGTLSNFTRDRLRGWLFQPPDAGDRILIVPPKTKMERVPDTYTRVLGAAIHDVAAQSADLAAAAWFRHPQLGNGAAYQHVLDSWRGAFSYAEEDQDNNIIGLRPPQIGAVHAVHSHWSVSNAPATIVMPTGTGKTETMLSVLVSAGCSRVLVVVPTDALRTQIADKFLTLGVLKLQHASILSEAALHPTVCVLKHIPRTVADVTALFERAHVIVTTSSIAGQCSPDVQQAIAAHCSHLFIDEAHHAEAPTWAAFKERFAARRVLQFTATPFREDGRPLDGKLIYVYPLRKAQAEGYFKPIQFLNVVEFDPNRADEAIAAAAIQQLRADLDKGHILMARVETVSRAQKVFQIYEQFHELNPVQLHTGVPGKAREEARQKILKKEARIVVCVDMLGEGFDLPELKIAAFHDIRKTLSVTLQLAGRFTRSRQDLGDATFIANTADVTVRDELRKLYTRDPDWNVLLPQLSDAMIGEQQSMQEFLRGFTNFVDEIPLKTVRPALSTVVYKTRCQNWAPENVRRGIPNVGSCEQVHIATNETEHTIVVVTALVAWCKHVGAKLLDTTIDPDLVLRGTLETTVLNVRPGGMPIGVDWPEEIYTTGEMPWSVSIGDRIKHISEVELEIAGPTLAGPIRFAIVAEDLRAEFELEFFQRGDTWDFRFVLNGDQPVRVIRAETPFNAADFFSENPPRVWFADGASLDGNEYTPLKANLPPYDPQRIQVWGWTGINIRKESQGDAKEPDSIQAAVIARLRAGDYELIFDDDEAGEAADVVAVRVIGGVTAPTQIDVEFYHCKYSSEDTAGARIDDLYVVCGQAQTSVRWMSSAEKKNDLFTHLLRRDAKRQSAGRATRFERGDRRLVETLREMSYTTRVTLKIVVVQPGVSLARISEAQLRLLSVTENYLMETYQLPFSVVMSA